MYIDRFLLISDQLLFINIYCGITFTFFFFHIFFQAAILQHTADFIQNLKREKDRLESENSQLKRMIEVYDSPPRKRWKRDTGT
jgi:hypothetical protein